MGACPLIIQSECTHTGKIDGLVEKLDLLNVKMAQEL